MNLPSILKLEEDGYVVDYNTNRNRVGTTPQGEKIKFKRDTRLCNRMPYIDMREQLVGVVMLESICKCFDEFTNKQANKDLEARRLQTKLAHPTDKQLKKMIIDGDIKNCDTQVQDVANT